MKPVIASHFNYRASLIRQMEWHGIRWRALPSESRDLYLHFRSLDLSAVDRIMLDCYSARGPKPRQPSCMLRSLLIMVATKCPTIPQWVETLHVSPFYALLSGFDPDDVPGVGTFYDFLDRLWALSTPNFSSHIKPPYKRELKNRRYAKFRCPLNNNGTCTCEHPCSDAKYGRTCSIAMETNIRLYTSPPRPSDEWKLMYNKRTASERVNKQIKLDYMLEACKHHCTKYLVCPRLSYHDADPPLQMEGSVIHMTVA